MAATPRSLLGVLAGSSPALEHCTLFMRRFPEERAPVFDRASSSIFLPYTTRRFLFQERTGQHHSPSRVPGHPLFRERDAPLARTLHVLVAALEDPHG